MSLVSPTTFVPRLRFPNARDKPLRAPRLSLLLPFFRHLKKLRKGSGKRLTELELLGWPH